MVLNITNSATTPKPNGPTFLDEYAGHVETLYETGARPLTTVGGTADVVTATMAVDLTASGFVDGMCVSLVWAATNTSNVTLSINGGANVPVVDAAGDALLAGAITAGLASVLRYTAGSWRIISSTGLNTGLIPPSYDVFTASGTWTKPVGLEDDRMIVVELWAGGGGGGNGGAAGGGGGGGGGYSRIELRAADVPSSVSVTIGAGGGATVSGGDTTFGTLATAYGGAAGANSSGNNGGNGGTGGGETQSGPSGGRSGGGSGGAGSTTLGVAGNPGSSALSIWGGGGGGGGGQGGGASNGGNGGHSVYGGAGGGGRNGNGGGNGSGGTSARGGNGGAAGVAGSAPAGAGGAGAAGARGEARIWVI